MLSFFILRFWFLDHELSRTKKKFDQLFPSIP